jgi:Asp-tRNA(Asn)/Glu-tRNA(Gln) amidotransferase A subunit family amidase
VNPAVARSARWRLVFDARLGARGGGREKARAPSALHGVPVAIKDSRPLPNTHDLPDPCRDHVPSQDAEVVLRLKYAGAIVLGKTNTPVRGGRTR